MNDRFIHISKQIYTRVLQARSVVLIPHQNPDGDALGASTGFASFLHDRHVPFTLFCATDHSDRLNFLPWTHAIETRPVFWDMNTPDMVVVFDSGDLRYAGVADYVAKLPPTTTIINIDHHVTNEFYGDYQLVDTSASSTAEVLYHFFDANTVHITPHMATSLLTGIITDTDNFTNAATSPRAILAASKLVEVGANFNGIKQHIYKSTPLDAFKLWGRIFSRLTKHHEFDIVYTYLTDADLKEYNLQDADVAGMSNFLNAISDGHAGLILKEKPNGDIKGSFRTTRNDVDVAKMAKHFGGGGHKKAAGFTVDGPIEDAIEHIFAELHTLFPDKNILETDSLMA